MTTDHDALQRMPSPAFSAWSPMVALLGALVAGWSPGWVTAAVWGVAVLCALPFRRFRLVVPLALLAWTAGWLASFALRLLESGVVGAFLR
jgi:hypothetical protein